jgi:hypothetical protein
MRPEPIDSTKELLTPPHIMLQFAHQYSNEYPVNAVVAALVEEMNMKDAETIQFGNTVYINHYDEDDKSSVFMRAMNVDTAANFVDNTENYVVYAFGRGVKTILTVYEDPVITSVIKAVESRVNKNNPELDAEITYEDDEDQTVATIKLLEDRKK